MVSDGVLQDTLEQHREFFNGLVGIFFRKLRHGVLHDIQRRMLVTNGKKRLFVGASLDFGKKR